MNEIKTLDDLIEKKYKLITTIGVFSALLLLSFNLQIPFLTFGLFAIFLLLIYELHLSIPHYQVDLWKFSSLHIIEAIFFLLVVMPIYLYFAKYSIVTHPENKLNFVFFFIFIPVAKFCSIAYERWLNQPEVIKFSEQKKNYRIWKSIVIGCFIVLSLEMAFLIMKSFGG